MADKQFFKGKELIEIVYTDLDVKALMSEDAYDLYVSSDSYLWLDNNGVIYEFLDCEFDESDFVRSYKDWTEFNSIFPK